MRPNPSQVLRPLTLAFALCVAVGSACASTPDPTSAGGDPAGSTTAAGDPADPASGVSTDPSVPGPTDPVSAPGPAGGTSPTAGQRVQSAVEGMLMGAIIGGQAGPIGAAVGGVTLLVYSAITGEVPLQGSSSGGGGGAPRSEAEREAELERQIETEIARQDSLEDEIERELARQEDLLEQIQRNEVLEEVAKDEPTLSEGDLIARADPRTAPRAPQERDLPLSIFDEEHRTIAKGKWGNAKPIEVLSRSLDADRDGAPEEVRYHDAATGVLLRKENDSDYDGAIDTWSRYEAGIVAEIQRDNDADGRPDEWERYGRDGRMEARDVDRNSDGNRDAFYLYEAASLVEERHDGNSDGTIDRVIHYVNRRIARTEEDTTGDGRMDTWTHFETAGGEEVIRRIEKDTSGDGNPDVFDTYEQIAGKPTLKQRDEDKNGDGEVDVKSIYENGKLKQREISDPALLPL